MRTKPLSLRFFAFVLSVIYTISNVAIAATPEAKKNHPPQTLTLHLAPSLEGERKFYTRAIEDSITQVQNWFAQNSFNIPREKIIDTAYIFDSVDVAREHMAKHFGVEKGKLPASFSGTVDGSTIFLTALPVYEKTFRTLYAAEPWTTQEYSKLIVHELSHRAHGIVATQLFGSEEGMGPRWFFEGLAVLIAEQFQDNKSKRLSWEEIAKYIELDNQDAIPSPVYPVYAQMLRSLEQKIPVAVMIKLANDRTFVDELHDKYKAQN